jgi:hypothetical protein
MNKTPDFNLDAPWQDPDIGGVNWTKIANVSVTNAQIGDAQVTNAKIADAQITNAKIADAQITNAKIANISADKITTGLLTVNPTTGGAVAIFVDNAGIIRIRSVSSTPGRLVFRNDAGTDLHEISGGSTSDMYIQPVSDGNGQMKMGQTSRKWSSIELTAVNQTLVQATSAGGFVLLGGHVKFTEILAVAGTATGLFRKLAVYDTGGTAWQIPLYQSIT